MYLLTIDSNRDLEDPMIVGPFLTKGAPMRQWAEEFCTENGIELDDTNLTDVHDADKTWYFYAYRFVAGGDSEHGGDFRVATGNPEEGVFSVTVEAKAILSPEEVDYR
jgi:hypothetical protein